MNRRPTLSDIAKSVGVSTSAVSLALRGRARVSTETADRIRAEAARLGYVQNKAAAGLRTARSDVVAVCLNDLSNPVFNEFLIHIEEALRGSGRIVFLGVVREDRELQQQFLRAAMEQGVSGMLMCPTHGTGPEDLDPLLAGGGQAPFPCVLFSRGLDDVALPQFTNDDRATGRIMAERLLEAGHREICWLGGGQQTNTARDRYAGFCEALEQAGWPHVPRHGPTSRAFGFETASERLRDGGSAVGFACFSDLIAFGVLSACEAHGVRPGRDVSVIGVDDMAEAAFSHPPLTTVGVDKAWIGHSAARHLVEGAEGAPVSQKSAPSYVQRSTVRSGQ